MDIEPNVPPTQPNWTSTPPAPPEKKKFPLWAWILIGFGACGCGCVPILAAILFPVFAQAKIAAKSTASMSNLKELNIAFQIYMADSDDIAMPKDRWHERLSEYLRPGVLEDPLIGAPNDKLGYGYNSAIAKADLAMLESPALQVVFGLTSTPGKDAVITKDTIRTIDRSSDKTLVGFADGHVSRLPVAEAQTKAWQPKLSKE